MYQVRPDLCATDCDIPPRDFLGKIWTDSLVHDDAALRLLVEVFILINDNISSDFKVIGEDHVILGTDYPFPLGRSRLLTPGRAR